MLDGNTSLEYKLCKKADGEAVNDCECILSIESVYPILTLTDSFVFKHLLNTKTITVEDTVNKLYRKDANGNDVLTPIATYISDNRIENTLYYDNELNGIVLSTFVNDIDSNLFKDTTLFNKVSVYMDTMYNNSNDRTKTLTINKRDVIKTLPLANDLTGTEIDIVTLTIPNFNNYTNMTSKRDSATGISEKLQSIEFLVVNTADIGWDVNSPVLHTIVTNNDINRMKLYVGKKPVSKIYIPLV